MARYQYQLEKKLLFFPLTFLFLALKVYLLIFLCAKKLERFRMNGEKGFSPHFPKSVGFCHHPGVFDVIMKL